MSTTSSPTQETVCVISAPQFQNKFLARRIEEQSGMKCLTAGSLEEVRLRLGEEYDHITLFLWDCWKKDLDRTLEGFKKANDVSLPKNSVVGLFNVEQRGRKKDKTLPSQIKGIFLVAISTEDFLKGVSCILEGKSWLAIDKGVCVGNGVFQDELLTQREKDILSLIQQGKSNRQIAEALGVKYKTVKNHCSNLFRKLNAPNRFHAALRAKEH